MKAGDAKGAIRGPSIAWWFAPAFFVAVAAFLSSQILAMRSIKGGGMEGGGLQASLNFEISRRPFLSFGFRNFLADLAWLEAVQVSGSRKMAPGDYDRLYLLVQTVANHDPRFVVPYLLGGLILGDSPNHAQESLKTLERGWSNHPADWRFPFYIGYIQYFSFGNPVEGGKALEAASRIPKSPPYMPLLAARMLAEGRKPETALAFLSELMKQETDPARRGILQRRIREVIVERDIQVLEHAVGEYRGRTGTVPEKLANLVEAGLIRKIPVEPHGGRYLLSPDGEIRSDRVTGRLRVFRSR